MSLDPTRAKSGSNFGHAVYFSDNVDKASSHVKANLPEFATVFARDQGKNYILITLVALERCKQHLPCEKDYALKEPPAGFDLLRDALIMGKIWMNMQCIMRTL
jgi:hypothetical protein